MSLNNPNSKYFLETGNHPWEPFLTEPRIQYLTWITRENRSKWGLKTSTVAITRFHDPDTLETVIDEWDQYEWQALLRADLRAKWYKPEDEFNLVTRSVDYDNGRNPGRHQIGN